MADSSPSETFYNSLVAELNEERAAVLGRYGRRVEEAIAEAEAHLARLDADDQRSVDAYRASRQQALRARADLCLQREMLGLTDHTWVDRIYGVPPYR